MMTMLLLVASALAQDAVSLSAVRTAQVGGTPAQLAFDTTVNGTLNASLSCAGKRFSASETIHPGSHIELPLTGLPVGSHDCKGTLTLVDAAGGEGSMPLSVQISVLEPLTLQVDPADLNLEQRSLTLQASRHLADIKVTVIGARNAELGGAELGGDGFDRVPLQWKQTDGDVVKVVIDATDVHGLSSRLELLPWSYAIPHEDVVFASGEHTVPASEVAKLEGAWTELQQVLDLYGEVVEVRLFVAGYTDTVGDPTANQALSARRAREIAGWFKTRGFRGPTAWQGFGESVLAVPTGDGTAEAANRRAVYLLAAEVPPISTELPKRSWTEL